MLPSDPLLRGRCRFDTVILSVLLDAGAGSQWTYRDHATNQTFRSSEGLAIASLELLNHGFFSVDDQCHLRVDAAKILSSSYASFAKMMQHHDGNPLQAVEGRWSLLQSLAHVMNERHEIFRDPTNHENRLGLFFDYLLLLPKDNRISASIVLKEVLEVFGPIWPGRLEREGYNLGDTWLHSAIKTGDETEQLVPFHKLSQWLTYSLLEPLEDFGIQVDDIDSLTGLPEYRNGGLFLDTGVIRLKSESLRNKTLHPSDEMIVEWRALTVHLLDQVALKMRQQLQGSSQSLPLAKVLQGGTWAAGRRLAKEMRNGAPPLLIELEGTVF
jgi:hypothetical protein